MRIFFISDLHFGHANIIRYCSRPFATVDEMDAALITNWNASVKQHDIIWVLGDVSFHHPQRTLEILNELNGHKKLVLGNHDKSIRKQKYLHNCFDEITDGFKEIYLQDSESNGSHFAVLCHYPMLSWNRAHHGALMLHGHVHAKQPIALGETLKRYDVGVDANNYAPVSLKLVLTSLNAINLSTSKQEYTSESNSTGKE